MPEAFICAYRRTPIGRYAGALSGVRPDDLAAIPIAAIMQECEQLDPTLVDEVVLGCANQAGEDNRNVARMATLLAGMPMSVAGTTINRLCGSGMDAVIAAARAIKSGELQMVIAGGVESMSRAPMVMPKAQSAYSRQAEIYDTTIGWRFVNSRMRQLHGVDSMPETGENVAAQFGVSRDEQDQFAFRSQTKAAKAQASGRFAKEIVSVTVPKKRGETVSVDHDEHLRLSSLEKLSSLPTPFRENGTVTAGNSSGVNDGAAALLIASEKAVFRHQLKPIARIVAGATAGVQPRVMGIGPVPAVQKLLLRSSQTLDKFDTIELNEAFASQAIAVMRELNLELGDQRVNPNGGAIALGHPLGMSGARLIGTAVLEMQEQGGRFALATMCVGVGQGIAISLERV